MSDLMPNFMAILPEIIVAVALCVLLLDSVFSIQNDKLRVQRLTQNGAVVLLLALGVMLFGKHSGETFLTFYGQFLVNDFTLYAKVLILLGGAAVLVLSSDSLEREGLQMPEYPALVLFATLGMMLMVSANDLIILFMGLELQSLALYVMAAMNRKQLASSEAALKYFILGAFSTGFYLYGASLIYGFTGSTQFQGIAEILRFGSEPVGLGLMVGMLFVLASIAFKISAAPFHMWTPDVYQGTPTAVTTFLAATPKVAALLLFVRLMMGPFEEMVHAWQGVIIGIALASMAVGAFAALRQTDIKRLLAYSSIGHMGYALVGMASGTPQGMEAVVIYITIYLVMTVGVFGCLLTLRGKNQVDIKNIDDLAGLSTSHPKMALTLALFMFSMAGIPPLAGFFGKFYVFMAALQSGLYVTAILGVLSSVVAAYYYLKIVKVMYFDGLPESTGTTYASSLTMTPSNAVVINLSVLFVLFFFLFPSVIMEVARLAIGSLNSF